MNKFLLVLLLALSGCLHSQQGSVKLVTTNLVWNKAHHNAFTTIESYGDYLYCAFREGSSHKSYDGKIRIIRSLDGSIWECVALISQRAEDLRDPKLITIKDKITLLFVSRTKDKHFSYTYSSENGKDWNYLGKTNDTWRWNATEFNNYVYSVGYSSKDKLGKIYRLDNDKNWIGVKDKLFPYPQNQANETKLFFNSNSKMFALVRQEKGNQNALLGVSNPPYVDWTWKDLGVRMGSPSGIVLNDNEILACVRLYDYPVRLSVVKINVENGSYDELVQFPSGGDTGYADIVYHNNDYYVSYYSSKNKSKRASIYLAKIKLNLK